MDTSYGPRSGKAFSLPLFYIREYFFPSGCGGCGQALLNQTDAYYGLCGDCRNLFHLVSGGEVRCLRCGRPLVSEAEICGGCRRREPALAWPDNAVAGEVMAGKKAALFPYTGKFKTILQSYKFGKSLGIGNFFAGFLVSAAVEAVQGSPEGAGRTAAAWVPVPPRPGKIRKQGWDQIAYLARLLEREYRLFPVNRCLKRLPSRSQKELNREERGSNLKGRILCVKQPPATALVFDDVITTGATMEACASALLKGGAEKVYGICLFYD